jgi:Asp-tRNA(Asn)/Glu-tRNA(Gln) amidotransferase A subunit family amidase
MNGIGANAAAVERCSAAIVQWEPVVQAWAHLDLEHAAAAAAQADREPVRPMSGITLGVKDIFDTSDQPTSYGSPLYEGHRPFADADAVVSLRGSGAISLGKTVTAEFAFAYPGPTKNPHRATHTPGGSSMGSAAAVASGMADVALGTQTAASITRPASFCGVYGFKPSYGAVSMAGVKLVAPSLDTVGWFARDPLLLDAAHVSLTGRPASELPSGPPLIAIARTSSWGAATTDSQNAVLDAATTAREMGAAISDAKSVDVLDGLVEAQQTVMAYEAARSLALEHHEHREDLSTLLLQLLDKGRLLHVDEYDDARRRRDQSASRLAALFGDADVLLTPAAVGEAPAGLASTGDPLFSRIWSLLGVPTLAIPWTTGSSGLPVGVQVVARPGQDLALLSFARWLKPKITAGEQSR